MAARSNGSVLVLDELAHVTGKELGKIIYTLAGGVGKKRMTAAATVRESYTWKTFAVLSAETSLEEKIRKDDGEWTAGQAVRMADIDVTGIDRTVGADVLARIDGIKSNYGHSGAAFAQAMIEEGLHHDPEALRGSINNTARRLAGIGLNGAQPDAALIRAANVFALLSIAGTLAKQFSLLPAAAPVDTAVRWAWDRFRLSSDAVALDPAQQAVANIQTWVAERWATSLHDIDDAEDLVDGGRRRPNKDALGWYDDNAVYLPDKRLIEAAGGTLKETEVARVLRARGCILRSKSEKHTFIDYVPKVGRVKAYALSREHFGRGSEKIPLKIVNGGRQ